MKREIKFRGRRVYNEEWIFGDFLQLGDCCIVIWDEEAGDYDYVSVLPDSVGQFIGWQDKDKQDVYEGDLIEIYWPDGVVTCETISYSEKYGYFMYGNNPICELKDPEMPIKVVGHIHQLNDARSIQGTHHMLHDPNVKQPEVAEQEQPAEQASEATETQPQQDSEEGNTEG